MRWRWRSWLRRNAASDCIAASSGWPRWIWCGSPRRSRQPLPRLRRLDNQLARAGANFIRPLCRAAGVEIEVDAVLAEACNLLPIARIGHQMNQPQRRIAEMGNPALDQIGLVEP